MILKVKTNSNNLFFIDYCIWMREYHEYKNSRTRKISNFLTNYFTIPAQTVADRYRWQVELFFK